jgi:uncharacterized protein YifN (PemK superfamily)
MEKFTEIIDTYFLNYDLYENGKISFECDYGELIFLKSNNKNDLILFAIYISSKYRENGLCRNILHYLIDKSLSYTKFKNLCVQTVLSKVLYEYLLRFTYKGKKFKEVKNGFVYKLSGL